MTSPSRSKSWQTLATHYLNLHSADTRISSLFEADPERCQRFSAEVEGIYLDYSKNLLTQETLQLLQELAKESGLTHAIAAMYSGRHINSTENRPALHVALRSELPEAPPEFNAAVKATLDKMASFVELIHSGAWTGFTGKAINTVINIGIGGSDLGPAMVTDALASWHVPQLRSRFVSNVDPAHMHSALADADPETTLFIIASKSFTTLETHQNAALARRWYLSKGGSEAMLAQHFVAVSANVEKARSFGIAADNIFPLWDWVGGRYSLWSAIGLPIALSVGMPAFRSLLKGASSIDAHFQNAAFEHNIPMIMGMLSVWYGGFAGASSQVVLPYSQALNLFPAFLQQLEMESLGKSVTLDGEPLQINSGPVVWGSPGTNGQHSFHQLLHQGTHLIPADFIAIKQTRFTVDEPQHLHLLANCFSQSQALMQGKTTHEAQAELIAQGCDEESARHLARHKAIAGNKPSNTLLLDALTPQLLGSLIAIYEHKVFVESVIWHINAFDQWGVELGKQLSVKLYDALTASGECAAFDTSTNELINRCRKAHA